MKWTTFKELWADIRKKNTFQANCHLTVKVVRDQTRPVPSSPTTTRRHYSIGSQSLSTSSLKELLQRTELFFKASDDLAEVLEKKGPKSVSYSNISACFMYSRSATIRKKRKRSLLLHFTDTKNITRLP